MSGGALTRSPLTSAAAIQSPTGDSPLPSSEAVARELPREPEQARAVWAEQIQIPELVYETPDLKAA